LTHRTKASLPIMSQCYKTFFHSLVFAGDRLEKYLKK
jgi:hypothetical protein